MSTKQEKIAKFQIDQNDCFVEEEKKTLKKICPPNPTKCVGRPEAFVPDWRTLDETSPFINQRTCHYSITITTEYLDTGTLSETDSPVDIYLKLSNQTAFCSTIENLELDINNELHKIYTVSESALLEQKIKDVQDSLNVSPQLAGRIFQQKEKAARRLIRFYGKVENRKNVRFLVDNMEAQEWFLDSTPNTPVLVLMAVPIDIFDTLESSLEFGKKGQSDDNSIAFTARGLKKRFDRVGKTLDMFHRINKVTKFVDKKKIVKSPDDPQEIDFSQLSNFCDMFPSHIGNFLFNYEIVFDAGPKRNVTRGLLTSDGDPLVRKLDYTQKIEFFYNDAGLTSIEITPEDCEPDEVITLDRAKVNLLTEKADLDNEMFLLLFLNIKSLDNRVKAKNFNLTALEAVRIAFGRGELESSNQAAKNGRVVSNDSLDPIERGPTTNKTSTKEAGENADEDSQGCVANFLDERGELDEFFEIFDLNSSPSIIDALLHAYNQEICGYDMERTELEDLYDEAIQRSYTKLVSDDQVFTEFCMELITFFEGKIKGSSQDLALADLMDIGLNRIRVCGLTKFLEEAIKCLLVSSTLEEGLARALRAGLNAMNPAIFEAFVFYLPLDKREFVSDYVRSRLDEQLASGNIGLINISEVPRAATDPDQNNNILRSADLSPGDGKFRSQFESAEDRAARVQNPQLANRPFLNPYNDEIFSNKNAVLSFDPTQEGAKTDSVLETLGKGGLGQPLFADSLFTVAEGQGVTGLNPSIGSAEGNIISFYIDGILLAYEDELLDLADRFTNFGSDNETLTSILSFTIMLIGGNCSRSPLFVPGIYEFIKNFELQFCRNTDGIRLPVFKGLPKIGDILGALKEAALFVLTEVAIRIISAIIEFICRTIGDAICKALGAVGDALIGSPDGDRDKFSALLQEAFCDSGAEASDADYEALASKLPQDLSSGKALAGPETKTFFSDLSQSLTMGEMKELVSGVVTRKAKRVGTNLVKLKYPDLIPILGTESKFVAFFSAVSDLFPADFKSNALDEIFEGADLEGPAFPSLCANEDDLQAFYDNRALLLGDRATPEEITQLNDDFKDKLGLNLSSLSEINEIGLEAFIGKNLPQLISSPGCDDGLISLEPEHSKVVSQQMAAQSLQAIQAAFFEDMIGDNLGYINTILSDTMGTPLPKHKIKTDFLSMFGFYDSQADKDEEGGLFDFFTDLAGAKAKFPTRVAGWLQDFYRQGKYLDGTPAPRAIDLQFYDNAGGRASADGNYDIKYRFQFDSESAFTKKLRIVEVINQEVGGKKDNVTSVDPDSDVIFSSDIELGTTNDIDTSQTSAQYLLSLAQQDPNHTNFVSLTEELEGLEDIQIDYLKQAATKISNNNQAFNFGYRFSPEVERKALIKGNGVSDNRVTFLPVEEYGGTEKRPYFTIRPPKYTGWLKLSQDIFKVRTSCGKFTTDIIGFREIEDEVKEKMSTKEEDPNLQKDPSCYIVRPFNKPYSKQAMSQIQTVMKAMIRIFGFEFLFRSVPVLGSLGQDFNSTYNEVLSSTLTDYLIDYLRDYKPKLKFFQNIFKNAETDKVFYYTFLELACIMYRDDLRDGTIQPTLQEARAANDLDNMVVDFTRPNKKKFKEGRDNKEEILNVQYETFREYKRLRRLRAIKQVEDEALILVRRIVFNEMQELLNNFSVPLSNAEMNTAYPTFTGQILSGFADIIATPIEETHVEGSSSDVPSIGHGEAPSIVGSFGSSNRFFFYIEKYIRLVEKQGTDFDIANRDDDLFGMVSPDRFKQFVDGLPIVTKDSYISDLFGNAVLKENEEVGPYELDGDIGLHYGVRICLVDKEGSMQLNANSEDKRLLKSFDFSNTTRTVLPLASFEVPAINKRLTEMNFMTAGSEELNCVLDKFSKSQFLQDLMNQVLGLKTMNSLLALHCSYSFLPSFGQNTVETGAFEDGPGSDGTLNSNGISQGVDGWHDYATRARNNIFSRGFDQKEAEFTVKTLELAKTVLKIQDGEDDLYRKPSKERLQFFENLSRALDFSSIGDIPLFMRRRLMEIPTDEEGNPCKAN